MKKLLLTVLSTLGAASLSSASPSSPTPERSREVCRWQARDSNGFLVGSGHFVGNSGNAYALARMQCEARYPFATCDVECDRMD
jgi:hypothetical protein